MPDSPPPKPDSGMGTDPEDEPKAEGAKPEGASGPESESSGTESGGEEQKNFDRLVQELNELFDDFSNKSHELEQKLQELSAKEAELEKRNKIKDLISKKSKEQKTEIIREIKEIKQEISKLMEGISKYIDQLADKNDEISDLLRAQTEEYKQKLEELQKSVQEALRKRESSSEHPTNETRRNADGNKEEPDSSDKNPEEEEPKNEQVEIEDEEPDASINDFDRYLQYIHRLKEINNEIRRITWGRRSGLVWAALNMHLAGFLGHFFLPVIGYYFGARWIVRREIKQRLRAQAKLNSLAVEAASILKELGPLHQRVQETLRGEPKDKFDEAARGFLRGPVEQTQKNLRKILTKASKHDRNRRRGSSGPGGREDGERPGKTRSRRFGGRATEPSRER